MPVQCTDILDITMFTYRQFECVAWTIVKVLS